MKKSITIIKPISIVVTLILVQLLGYLSISIFGDYGWNVFFFLPIIIGFLPVYITGRKNGLKLSTAYFLGFSTLVLEVVALLIFAVEGLICVFMASPLLILGVLLGSYLGYKSSKSNYSNPTHTAILLLFMSLGFMGFDYVNEPMELIPVRTSIIVDAPIEKVWTNVVTFEKIHEPVHWIFKTGISYPTDATIVGTGVGAVRYCNFTTGSFVEPITTWSEPNLLQFDVSEQPIPMNEANPFWEVHPPHLDGYFKSYKGQFKLTPINDDQTELEGTTWYKVDINPVLYWRAWSDYIVHRIHERVLNHIKEVSERRSFSASSNTKTPAPGIDN